MALRRIEPFRLRCEDTQSKPKQPVVRVKPSYYQLLEQLKKQTGLPLGNIVEQCIDYAIANMEKGDDTNE